jgi:hypothetical protein
VVGTELQVVPMVSSVLDLCRVYSRGSSAVTELAAVPLLHDGLLVTATTEAVGRRLRVTAWRVDQPSGAMSMLRNSEQQAGVATSIDIAKGALYVTAMRTSQGDLKLISWEVVAAARTITRRGDSGTQAGEATRIRIVAVSPKLFVTAFRTAEGTLKVVPWRLTDTGAVHRLAPGVTTTEKVSEIDLAVQSTSGGGGRLVSIARITGKAEAIKLISWKVAADGVVSRLRDSGNQAGNGSMVRVVLGGHNYVMAAAKVGLDVKVAAWSVAADGTLTPRGSGLGPADITFCEGLLGHPDGAVCATRAADGRIKLAAFTTTPDGTVTLRSDSALQAESGTLVDLVAADGTADTAGRRISTIALVRAANQGLEFTSWGPACLRLHIKVLAQPNVPIETMLTAMRVVYATVGIRVRHLSTEALSLPALEDLDVGADQFQPTKAEHIELFTHRNNVANGDIVVYFVRSTNPPLNGTAAHPPGRPGAVVTSVATEYTLAHEVGHVLGLGHINDNSRLMTLNGTTLITKPPPDLAADEASVMQGSEFTDVCPGT